MFEDETLLDEAGINRRSNSASFIDKIKPNIKYYYTFRCVDIHGQISNPSEVYEVEIVNESGAIYSNIVPYEFPKEEQGETTKKFKRFLMIKPNALQSYMDIDEEIQNYKDYERMGIKLGIKDDSIIDKKYKMRIVSKNSDKVYDINFSFGKIVKIIE